MHALRCDRPGGCYIDLMIHGLIFMLSERTGEWSSSYVIADRQKNCMGYCLDCGFVRVHQSVAIPSNGLSLKLRANAA